MNHVPRQRFEVPRPLPDGLPLVEPAEAIAIGIYAHAEGPVNPNGKLVRNILDALRLAGWEIVPVRK
jgi:hypothetical protein